MHFKTTNSAILTNSYTYNQIVYNKIIVGALTDFLNNMACNKMICLDKKPLGGPGGSSCNQR